MLKNLLFGGESNLWWSTNLGTTLLRIFAGCSLAFGHGLSKLPPGDAFIANTEQLGFPLPHLFSWAAGLSEFLGGIFLALGFLTRPAALFIAFTMGVAVFGVHAADPYQKKELAVAYLMIAGMFLFKGSGDWSIDRTLRR